MLVMSDRINLTTKQTDRHNRQTDRPGGRQRDTYRTGGRQRDTYRPDGRKTHTVRQTDQVVGHRRRGMSGASRDYIHVISMPWQVLLRRYIL